MLEITKTLYVTDRKSWRAWLRKNHKTAKDIWLIYPHKGLGRERIVYNDAVEEALCFGWIDSTVKSYTKDSSAQRFTARRKGSPYSQMNKERIMWLLKHNQVPKAFLSALQDIVSDVYVPAPDIVQAIRANKEAWKYWQTFAPSYQRIRVWYIDDYRGDPERFQKSLAHLIKKTEKGKQFRYGGIEKYF